ncbi:MAG: hypothetical protein M3252_05610, partial [Actinomycetota bacterium]|nr:hypothetical protein [Actinomycetota bacterium]
AQRRPARQPCRGHNRDGRRSPHARMTFKSVYDTSADLEQVLSMGVEEGIRTAVEQDPRLLGRGLSLAPPT